MKRQQECFDDHPSDHKVLADLRHDGILTLDATPAGLTPSLVNEYLAIKARHLL